MEKVKTIEILPKFVEYSGRTFNVKNIAYPNHAETYHFGKFIKSTHDHDGNSDYNEENGVNIYQDEQNPRIGYRIYKGLPLFLDDFFFYGGLGDPKIVEELIKRQPNVKLTDFPTGIVSINKHPVGQEIPFYPEHQSLQEFSQSIADTEGRGTILSEAYLNILLSLQELEENEVYYGDIHPGNFLVNFKDQAIDTRIIDYESGNINFGKLAKYQKEHYSSCLGLMFNVVNQIANIDYKIEALSNDKPLDDAIEKVLTMGQKTKE